MEKNYFFTITLLGQGETPKDAWQDAVDHFATDPGSTPDEYQTEYEDPPRPEARRDEGLTPTQRFGTIYPTDGL